jgi:hypothetical protein
METPIGGRSGAPLTAVALILPIFRPSAIASRQGARCALPTFDDLGQVHDMPGTALAHPAPGFVTLAMLSMWTPEISV